MKNKLRASVASMALIASLGVNAVYAADEAAVEEREESIAFGEIVVTARKREESLLEIPVSVTAIAGPALERAGVVSVDGLIGRVPSLYFSQNNSRQSTADNAALVIRGVGANPVLEPSVGTYLDGIYLPSLGFDLALLDVERVDILRGPQGSLFGRNTEGGAINIVTRKPDEELRGRAFAEFDDLKSYRAGGSVSGPVIDDLLFVGFSFGASTTDGFTRNVFLDVDGDDRDVATGRLSVRLTPSDSTEIILTADFLTENGRESGTAIPAEDVGAGIENTSDETFNFVSDFAGDASEDNAGLSLTIEHEFENMVFTSLTGYREINSSRAVDTDGLAEGAFNVNNDQRTFADQTSFSQELRLSSSGDGNFDWLVGVYYYNEDDKFETDINFGSTFNPDAPGVAITSSTQDREGYAIFAQANLALADEFIDLTIGARYSDDKIDGERFNFISIPFPSGFLFERTNPDPTDPDATGEASVEFSNFSATGQAVLNVSDAFRPYVNVSQGYKGGGFDRYPTSSSLYLPVEEETTVNYEIGAKGVLAGGRISYAFAVYRINIDNLQQPTQVINPDTGLPATAIFNAGEAHTQGFEFEGNFQVNDNLSFNISASHTDAEFDVFIDQDGNDRNGDPIPNVPDWTFNVGVDVVLPISDTVDFIASGSYRYVGSYITGLNTAADAEFEYDSYGIIDMDAGLRIDQRHELTFFVRNLADNYVVLNQGGGSFSGFDFARVHAPRIFGARISTEW